MEVAGDAMVGSTANAEVRSENSRTAQETGVGYANESAHRFKDTTKGDTDASK